MQTGNQKSLGGLFWNENKSGDSHLGRNGLRAAVGTWAVEVDLLSGAPPLRWFSIHNAQAPRLAPHTSQSREGPEGGLATLDRPALARSLGHTMWMWPLGPTLVEVSLGVV